jgi:Secretion system C-terminal sorting domain
VEKERLNQSISPVLTSEKASIMRTLLYILTVLCFNHIAFGQAEKALITGFAEYGLRPDYHNTMVRFRPDTVLVDSIPYIMSTHGVGDGMLWKDTLIFVHNGMVARNTKWSKYPNFDSDYDYNMADGDADPFRPWADSLGNLLPQSSLIYLLGPRGNDTLPRFQFHSANSDFRVFPGFYCRSLMIGTGLFERVSNGTATYYAGIQSRIYNGDYKFQSQDIYQTTAAFVRSGHSKNVQFGISAHTERNAFYLHRKDGPANLYQIRTDQDSLYVPQEDTTANCQHKRATLFSPNGEVFAVWGDCKIQLMDFDRCTRKVSNYREVIPPITRLIPGGGLAFSPSGRFLYVSDYQRLFRIDMESQPLKMVQVTAPYGGNWPNEVQMVPAASYSYMYLAPDEKIYIVPPYRAKFMHVLENTDAVNHMEVVIKKEGLALGSYNMMTLTGYINENLGLLAGGGALCDTITTSIGYVNQNQSKDLLLYPNPASTKVHWEVPMGSESSFTALQVLNSVGSMVHEQRLFAFNGEGDIDVSMWRNGVYIIKTTRSDGSSSISKFIKMD